MHPDKCEFCGQGGDIEMQDMGDKRVLWLCERCRHHIAQGLEREKKPMQPITLHMTSYQPLTSALEYAVRKNEIQEAIWIVEKCGASPELTAAVMALGERMNQLDNEAVYWYRNAPMSW